MRIMHLEKWLNIKSFIQNTYYLLIKLEIIYVSKIMVTWVAKNSW